MVVNVITRHAPTNYGSLLQAIATQRVIMNLGHECRIINYIPKCETGVRMAITQLEQKTKWRRNPIKKAIYLMVAEPETLLMDRKFLAMRKKYLQMGPCCATTGELKKLYAEKKDEVFLTGSDQVWGPISTGHYDPTYFLDFVPKSSRKLAFAASFGKAIFDEQTLKEYGVLLKKYDSLAVRENVAVELLKKMDISAKQVLDPTLLMDADAWSEYVKPMKKPEKYVLVYQIHANSDLDHYWNEENHRKEVVVACRINKQKNLFMLLDAYRIVWEKRQDYKLSIYGEGELKQKNIVFQWLRGYYIVGNSKFGSSIFSKITAAVDEGKTEFPFTLGQNQYDFIDYPDFCAQVAAVVGQKNEQGIINICSGKPEKLADRVERFIKENDYRIKLQYGAFPDRPYDSKAIWGNDTKIRKIMEN